MISTELIPLALQTPVPRDPCAAGDLLDNKPLNIPGLIALFVLAPIGFVGVIWLRSGIGSFSDLMLGVSLGLGLDFIVGLFAVGISVQRKRGALLFRDGTATTGTVQQVQTPRDGSQASYGFLKVEYQDDAGRIHIGTFSTVGTKKNTDVYAGSLVAVLYLPDDPRKCGFYTPGLGMVPGRAPS